MICYYRLKLPFYIDFDFMTHLCYGLQRHPFVRNEQKIQRKARPEGKHTKKKKNTQKSIKKLVISHFKTFL